ncbi:MAG: hypothetical protein PVI23_00090 [Maricaulaceae bacterium]
MASLHEHGVELTAEELQAVSFAPRLAGMRIRASEWDGVCPADDPDWASRADRRRQGLALHDAGALGNLEALWCVARWNEGEDSSVLREEAYGALLTARAWGAEVESERLERLEAALSVEAVQRTQEDTAFQQENIAVTLAYERKYGPIPPELAREPSVEAPAASAP